MACKDGFMHTATPMAHAAGMPTLPGQPPLTINLRTTNGRKQLVEWYATQAQLPVEGMQALFDVGHRIQKHVGVGEAEYLFGECALPEAIETSEALPKTYQRAVALMNKAVRENASSADIARTVAAYEEAMGSGAFSRERYLSLLDVPIGISTETKTIDRAKLFGKGQLASEMGLHCRSLELSKLLSDGSEEWRSSDGVIVRRWNEEGACNARVTGIGHPYLTAVSFDDGD